MTGCVIRSVRSVKARPMFPTTSQKIRSTVCWSRSVPTKCPVGSVHVVGLERWPPGPVQREVAEHEDLPEELDDPGWCPPP
jgi:hypothetical protein